MLHNNNKREKEGKARRLFHADEGVDVGEPTPNASWLSERVPRYPAFMHVTLHPLTK